LVFFIEIALTDKNQFKFPYPHMFVTKNAETYGYLHFTNTYSKYMVVQ